MRKKMWLFVRLFCFAWLLAGMPALVQRTAAAMTQVSVQETVEIKGIDGNTYTPTSFSESAVALIFGRTTCGNTRGMLEAAEEIQKSGCSVKIVLMCVTDQYAGENEIKTFAGTHPNVLVTTAQYDSLMWKLLRSCGITSNSITLPATFIMDKGRTIVFASTGPDAEGLGQALRAAETMEPQTPAAPGASETPQTPQTPQASQIPQTPQVSQANGSPAVTPPTAAPVSGQKTGKKAEKANAKAARPKAPKLTSVKRKAGTKAVLKWKKVSGAGGYEIQMSTSGNRGFKKIKKITAGRQTFTKAGLSKKKKYYFRIRSYKKVNGKTVYSAWSGIKKI